MRNESPANPLLESKLHIPRARRTLVARPRLLARLNDAVDAKLILMSAPAGFGKTTLVTAWLHTVAEAGGAVAWLSLDERDNDPGTLWAYVLAALESAVPGLGANARALLDAAGPPSDAVLATLVNELHGLDRDVILVLDDFHVLDRPDHDDVAYLVDHLPDRVRLAITSRSDPPLPLPRLRARGQLLEIRAADLRFTGDEAAAYLNGAMGLELTTGDIATLEARTEGWIAALQLAALSLQGRDDVASFIADFAGDDRFIVDYLAGEVLQRQPESVRQFLLHTSVLDRLQGALCDAVTGTTGSKATLEALDRENLFVIPLDARREWYRYHHLFAEVLRARLLDEEPDAPAELHRRASAWFAAHDEPSDAIRHALAAGDVDRAAELVELALPSMRRRRQDATIRSWEKLIPDAVVRERPVLAIGFVGALMSTGEMDRVEDRLHGVERWLALEPPTREAAGMIVVDEAQRRALPGAVEMYRAALALIRGDTVATVDHARRTLALAPDDDDMGRAAAHALLGLAAWSEGDLDTAFAEYTDSIAAMHRAGHIADILSASIAMADIRIAQGRLRDAQLLYEQNLQLLADHGAGPLRGAADMYVGLAEILRERDDREGAAEQLQRARELELFGTRQYPYRSRAVEAGLRLAAGDIAACLTLLDEAERVYDTDFSPAVRPIGARRARAYVRQGDLNPARAWIRERNLSTADELRYVTEFEHITLAIIIVNDAPDERALQQVSAMLDRLLAAAEAGARGSSVIEILAVQALTYDARGDTPRALDALRRAVALAEPEGYVRVFDYLGGRLHELRDALASGSRPARPRQDALVDPLSDRELDVLRLLRSDLSGPDIARELTVSLNTMRTHTKSIYTKLAVNNRREAVRRADELGL
ncbi:MAG TPA: LuxR C-terminal-related transcriptional regulator [Acidimicrobiia bacterium]|nr:LuxR C-terminal-related transcriptional regulator [Acidimicrobiia bacterium]